LNGFTPRAAIMEDRMAQPDTPGAQSRPSAGRRERKKRDKLDRIVRAATEPFREQDFDETTGREICARAEIATGTLFLYVRDKRELLLLIFRPRAERVFSRAPTGLREGEGVVDGLMHLFGALVRLYARDLRLARLFVQELPFRSDQADGMEALNTALRAHVAAIVGDAVRVEGLRADVAPERIAHAVMAHYVLWLQLWLGKASVGRQAAERGMRDALELQLEDIGTTRHMESRSRR